MKDATFKLLGLFVKWSAVTVAAGASIWHGIKAAFQFWK